MGRKPPCLKDWCCLKDRLITVELDKRRVGRRGASIRMHGWGVDVIEGTEENRVRAEVWAGVYVRRGGLGVRLRMSRSQ